MSYENVWMESNHLYGGIVGDLGEHKKQDTMLNANTLSSEYATHHANNLSHAYLKKKKKHNICCNWLNDSVTHYGMF